MDKPIDDEVVDMDEETAKQLEESEDEIRSKSKNDEEPTKPLTTDETKQ